MNGPSLRSGRVKKSGRDGVIRGRSGGSGVGRSISIAQCRRLRSRWNDRPLTGKLHAILARPWAKGRDWFDLVWYLAEHRGLEPNRKLLENALAQTKTRPLPRQGWRGAVRDRLNALDWRVVAADLLPFVERPGDIDLLSRDAIARLLGR